MFTDLFVFFFKVKHLFFFNLYIISKTVPSAFLACLSYVIYLFIEFIYFSVVNVTLLIADVYISRHVRTTLNMSVLENKKIEQNKQ